MRDYFEVLCCDAKMMNMKLIRMLYNDDVLITSTHYIMMMFLQPTQVKGYFFLIVSSYTSLALYYRDGLDRTFQLGWGVVM